MYKLYGCCVEVVCWWSIVVAVLKCQEVYLGPSPAPLFSKRRYRKICEGPITKKDRDITLLHQAEEDVRLRDFYTRTFRQPPVCSSHRTVYHILHCVSLADENDQSASYLIEDDTLGGAELQHTFE